jgi:hypothetical protein
MSDAALARKLGRTQLAVRQARVRRGLAAWRQERRWTKREDRQVLRAAVPARELASRLGRTREAVLMRRKRLERKRASASPQ